jgi:hypothetical protein
MKQCELAALPGRPFSVGATFASIAFRPNAKQAVPGNGYACSTDPRARRQPARNRSKVWQVFRFAGESAPCQRQNDLDSQDWHEVTVADQVNRLFPDVWPPSLGRRRPIDRILTFSRPFSLRRLGFRPRVTDNSDGRGSRQRGAPVWCLAEVRMDRTVIWRGFLYLALPFWAAIGVLTWGVWMCWG